MGGDTRAQKLEWARIREHMQSSTPEVPERILGCYLHFEKIDDHKSRVTYEMKNFFDDVLSRYRALEHAPKLRTGVKTPACSFDPASFSDPEQQSPGIMQAEAASLLMALMYGARACRPDLLQSITSTARFLHRWSKQADQRMRQIFSYVQATRDTGLSGVVDDRDRECFEMHCYADADLAGSDDSCKSTSGGCLMAKGLNGTTCLLDYYSSRQKCTSHSTTEAEIVSLCKLVRDCSFPSELMWNEILKRPVRHIHWEDNVGAISIVRAGFAISMRGIVKHQRVSISALFEHFIEGKRELRHVPTALQIADGFTKGLTTSTTMQAWNTLLGLNVATAS